MFTTENPIALALALPALFDGGISSGPARVAALGAVATEGRADYDTVVRSLWKANKVGAAAIVDTALAIMGVDA
jgi:hypothetical protein